MYKLILIAVLKESFFFFFCSRGPQRAMEMMEMKRIERVEATMAHNTGTVLTLHVSFLAEYTGRQAGMSSCRILTSLAV
jgi:hypothetical protein